MPLQVLEAVDADAPRIAAIERAAYAPSPFNAILFPGPFPDDVLERRASELVAMRQDDPTTRWLKVVDTDLAGDDGLVAFACWHFYRPKPPPQPPRAMRTEGINLEACGRVFGGVSQMQEKIMGGKDYVFLKTLLTDPKHQKRGAGGLLVKWGADEATKLGLPAYLGASEAGRGLYLKHGFVDVDKDEVDMSSWGFDALHTTWGMVREPPA